MRTQTVALHTGVTIEYTRSGPAGAPVLLFLHGNGPNLRQFAMQRPYFMGDYQVLLMSLRGHGASTGPAQPTVATYTVRALAEDVVALLDHLEIDAVHVVGNSLGGLVAYELWELAPGRVRSLTTFGTTAELHSSRLTVWAMLGAIRVLGPQGLGELVARSASQHDRVAARIGQMYAEADPDALALITRNLADYDYRDTLRRCSAPLLLIRGDLDRDINAHLASTLAVLRDKPDARVVELTGVGHFANMERPTAFNQVLDAFLCDAAGF